jgi:hypothetical protein
MTGQAQVKSPQNQGWKERAEVFQGSTIRELAGLVEEVMRAHKTTVQPRAAVTVNPSSTSNGFPAGASR